jgi:hypothetical protein
VVLNGRGRTGARRGGSDDGDDGVEMRRALVEQPNHTANGNPRRRRNDDREGSTVTRSPRPRLDDDAESISNSAKHARIEKRHPTVGGRRHASVGVNAEGARIVPPMRTAPDAHNPLEGFRVSGLEEGAATVVAVAQPRKSGATNAMPRTLVRAHLLRPREKVPKLKSNAKVSANATAAEM